MSTSMSCTVREMSPENSTQFSMGEEEIIYMQALFINEGIDMYMYRS